MLQNVDLKILRVPAIALAVAIAASVGGSIGSEILMQAQKKEARKESRRAKTMSRKYEAAKVDIKHVGKYYPLFQKLRERGIIGKGDRVQRVEALAEEAKYLNLSSLQYTISPEVNYEPKFNVERSDAQLVGSEMKITMGLLHEEDLIDLLNRLYESQQGIFLVNDCKIVRTVKNVKRNSAAANMDGGCTMQWFNVKSKTDAWNEDEKKKGGT